MGRQVISKADVPESLRDVGDPALGESGSPISRPDEYTMRLLKYIPAEIIALYVSLETTLRAFQLDEAVLQSPNVNVGVLHWLVFLVLLISTPLYLWRVAKVSKTVQLFISTSAFAIWVFALGGPFVQYGWYSPLYGAVLLPLFTFMIAMVGE